MRRIKYLKGLKSEKPALNSGAKTKSLLKLKKMGFNIPFTYFIPYEIHKKYLENPDDVIRELKNEIERLPKIKYAVRSSASTEDGSEKSYAGQFNSYLDVEGTQNIVDSVIAVWNSVSSPESNKYLESEVTDYEEVKMSVIIQQMIYPIYSGVAFSRNPLTGIREIIVEAVKGSGISIMQEGMTPYRWVSHSGHFTKCPDTNVMQPEIIESIVKETKKISKITKMDVDLEWVWNGSELFWVQMRKITSLKGVKLYSNRISKEMLAGLIKPLIWSINIPLINGVWIDILKEITGPNEIKPHDLARPFYYRAYFNMGLLEDVFESVGIPAESLEVMWGFAPRENKKMSFKPSLKMTGLAPRMIIFIHKKWHLPKLMDKKLPDLEERLKKIREENLDLKSSEELLNEIDKLFAILKELAYFNITAPLSLMIYSYIFRKQLERTGNELSSIDMRGNENIIRRFNPGNYLEKLNLIYGKMSDEAKTFIDKNFMQGNFSDKKGIDDHHLINEFNDVFSKFIKDFGHLSDNGNDFSYRTWKEEPEKLIKIIKNFDSGKEIKNKVYPLSIENALPKGVIRKKIMKSMYKRARQFSEYRDYVSYIYTYGYGLFRPYFMQLGSIFTTRNWINEKEDIFFLEFDEIKYYLNSNSKTEKIKKIIHDRKTDMELSKDYILPEFIYGDQPPPPEIPYLDKLVGVATSGGYCTGTVKVIEGMTDFDKVKTGDIIVIPHSDVSWTVLFNKACGVIAQSGGMLSHSSIVAREYGIPAVVSVSGAMHLKDGLIARIDGYKGEITIINI